MSLRKIKKIDPVTWAGVGLLCAVLMFSTIVFLYVDLTNTVDNANILLWAVKHGRMLDFYELSVVRSQTSFSANYNFLVYVIFAVWQAPAYLAAHVLGRTYLLWPWAMLWSKLLVVLFSMAVAFWIYKIVVFCGKSPERGMLAVFIYFSSMTVMFPVFISAQIDSISMSFMLAGVYWYIKGKNKRFWIMFLIAAPLKMFALILALPLVLLKEKNLLKASVWWVSMTGLVVFEKFLFRNSDLYGVALGSQSRDAIKNLLGANLQLGRPITVFLLVYLFVCLYCFLKKNAGNDTIIWLCLCIWGVFVTTSSINTYWIYLAAPFLAIVICVNDRFIRTNILLETIGGFGYILFLADDSSYIFRDSDLVSRLFLSRMMTVPERGMLKYGSVCNLFVKRDLTQYKPLLSTVFVAAVFAIIVLTLPKFQEGKKESSGKEFWIIRPLLVFFMASLVVYGYTASTNPIAFDTRGLENEASGIDLLPSAEANIVSQTFTMEDDRKLDELVLKFSNSFYARSNMSLLYMDIFDSGTGDCIFESVRGCSFIKDNTDVSFNLGKTEVKKGHTYEIRLRATPVSRYYVNSAHLCPYISYGAEEKLDTMDINGTAADCYLYFELR